MWIVVYCVLQSLANPLNKRIGIEYSASAAFCILQAVILFAFIQKNHLQKRSAPAGQSRRLPRPADERQAGRAQELHPRGRSGYARDSRVEVAYLSFSSFLLYSAEKAADTTAAFSCFYAILRYLRGLNIYEAS